LQIDVALRRFKEILHVANHKSKIESVNWSCEEFFWIEFRLFPSHPFIAAFRKKHPTPKPIWLRYAHCDHCNGEDGSGGDCTDCNSLPVQWYAIATIGNCFDRCIDGSSRTVATIAL
jgi:hypothetical protein